MAIYRVLSGTCTCDKCGKLLAHVRFDAKDEINISRVGVLCPECYAAQQSKKEGSDE